jgi:hypothetical protein
LSRKSLDCGHILSINPQRLKKPFGVLPKIWLDICLVAFLIGIVPLRLSAQQSPKDKPGGLRSAVTPSPEITVPVVEGDWQAHNDTVPLQSLGLILLGILLFGVLHIYKQRQQRAQIVQKTLIRSQQERQQLLAAIAQLDDHYAQGIMAEQSYSAKRNQLKQQLVALTIQCKTR